MGRLVGIQHRAVYAEQRGEARVASAISRAWLRWGTCDLERQLQQASDPHLSAGCIRVLIVKTGCITSETAVPEAVAATMYTADGERRASAGRASCIRVRSALSWLYPNM